MVKHKMHIDSKAIGKFLKGLSDVEFLYLESVVDMVKAIKRTIKAHDLTKEQVCEIFDIPESKYEDYVKGNRNYDLHDMAALNAAYVKYESIKLAESVPVQVASKNKEDRS